MSQWYEFNSDSIETYSNENLLPLNSKIKTSATISYTPTETGKVIDNLELLLSSTQTSASYIISKIRVEIDVFSGQSLGYFPCNLQGYSSAKSKWVNIATLQLPITSTTSTHYYVGEYTVSTMSYSNYYGDNSNLGKLLGCKVNFSGSTGGQVTNGSKNVKVDFTSQSETRLRAKNNTIVDDYEVPYCTANAHTGYTFYRWNPVQAAVIKSTQNEAITFTASFNVVTYTAHVYEDMDEEELWSINYTYNYVDQKLYIPLLTYEDDSRLIGYKVTQVKVTSVASDNVGWEKGSLHTLPHTWGVGKYAGNVSLQASIVEPNTFYIKYIYGSESVTETYTYRAEAHFKSGLGYNWKVTSENNGSWKKGTTYTEGAQIPTSTYGGTISNPIELTGELINYTITYVYETESGVLDTQDYNVENESSLTFESFSYKNGKWIQRAGDVGKGRQPENYKLLSSSGSFSGWSASDIYLIDKPLYVSGNKKLGNVTLIVNELKEVEYRINYLFNTSVLSKVTDYKYYNNFTIESPTIYYSNGWEAKNWHVAKNDGNWKTTESYGPGTTEIAAETKYGGLMDDPIQLKATSTDLQKATRYIYYIKNDNTLIHSQEYYVDNGTKFADAKDYDPAHPYLENLEGVICYVVKNADYSVWTPGTKYTPNNVEGKTASKDVPYSCHGNVWLYCRWNLGCETVTASQVYYWYKGEDQTLNYSDIPNSGGCNILNTTKKDAGTYFATFEPKPDWCWNTSECNWDTISIKWTIKKCPLYVRKNDTAQFAVNWSGTQQILNSETGHIIVSRSQTTTLPPYDNDVFSKGPEIIIPASAVGGSETYNLTYTQNNPNYDITKETDSVTVRVDPIIRFLPGAEGITGQMDDQSFIWNESGISVKLNPNRYYFDEQHAFKWWQVKDSSAHYSNEETINIPAETNTCLTLIAVWTDVGTVSHFDAWFENNPSEPETKKYCTFTISGADDTATYTAKLEVEPDEWAASESVGYKTWISPEITLVKSLTQGIYTSDYQIPYDVLLRRTDSNKLPIKVILTTNISEKSMTTSNSFNVDIPDKVIPSIDTNEFKLVELNSNILNSSKNGTFYGGQSKKKTKDTTYYDSLVSIIDVVVKNASPNYPGAGEMPYDANYTYNAEITFSIYEGNDLLKDRNGNDAKLSIRPYRDADGVHHDVFGNYKFAIPLDNKWTDGTHILTLKISDSRNREVSESKSITFTKYDKPQIDAENCSMQRMDDTDKKYDTLQTSLKYNTTDNLKINKLSIEYRPGYTANLEYYTGHQKDAKKLFVKGKLNEFYNNSVWYQAKTLVKIKKDESLEDTYTVGATEIPAATKNNVNKEFLVVKNDNVYDEYTVVELYNTDLEHVHISETVEVSPEYVVQLKGQTWWVNNRKDIDTGDPVDHYPSYLKYPEETSFTDNKLVTTIKGHSFLSEGTYQGKKEFSQENDYEFRFILEDEFHHKTTIESSPVCKIRKVLTKLLIENPIFETDFDDIRGYVNKNSNAQKIRKNQLQTILNFRADNYSYNGFDPSSNIDIQQLSEKIFDETSFVLDPKQTKALVEILYKINNTESSSKEKYTEKFQKSTWIYNQLKLAEENKEQIRMVALDRSQQLNIYDDINNISDLVYYLSTLTPFVSNPNYTPDITPETKEEKSVTEDDIITKEYYDNSTGKWTSARPNEPSDCKADCMGLCTSGCYSTCMGGCATECGFSCSSNCQSTCGGTCGAECGGSCTGDCTGNCGYQCLSSCGNDCSEGCYSNCKGNCATTCGNGCEDTCQGNCKTDCNNSCSHNCGSSCAGGCRTGCGSTCGWSCTSDCSNKCTSECKTGCASACSFDCDNSCAKNCIGYCKRSCEGCTATCLSSCWKTCKTDCTEDCYTLCNGKCSAECKTACTDGCTIGCDGGCKNGCTGQCSGACNKTCTGACSNTCTAVANASAQLNKTPNDCAGACSTTCQISCQNYCDKGCWGCTNTCNVNHKNNRSYMR